MDEALRRVTGDQLAQLMFPQFDAGRGDRRALIAGINASPGAAVGGSSSTARPPSTWPPRART